MTLLIQASHLAFAHGGHDVSTGLTFEIRKDDRIVVVGESGSGKSTLFRLLAKSLEPAQGEVIHRRGLRTGYLAQEIARLADTTPRDVVSGTVNHPDAIEKTLAELEARLAEPLGDAEMADVLDAYSHTLSRLETVGDEAPEALALRCRHLVRPPEERRGAGRTSDGLTIDSGPPCGFQSGEPSQDVMSTRKSLRNRQDPHDDHCQRISD